MKRVNCKNTKLLLGLVVACLSNLPAFAEDAAYSMAEGDSIEQDIAVDEGLPINDSVPQDTALVRQRPGEDPRRTFIEPWIYSSERGINSSATEFVSVPDRWNMFYEGKWFDPYNQNILKGDLPIAGTQEHPWFVEMSAISDSLLEFHRIPIPVGGATTSRPGSNDTFGDGRQTVFSQNLILSLAFINGNTTFRPQTLEFRATPVFNYNYVNGYEDGVLRINPSYGDSRGDSFVGFNELFAEIHLMDLSDNYDFVSSRLGIQKFSSDFRGFVFNTEAPGVRVFGNYDNNKLQYNLAWFSLLDKDTNSGINTFESRHQNVIIANAYRQDMLALGHQLNFSVIHSEDNAGDFGEDYDNNGFLARPAAVGDELNKNVSATYLGVSGDGHFDRINTTFAAYWVTGSESHNPIAQQQVDVNAGLAAAEVSYDDNWLRYRVSVMWASGDGDADDNEANGFDSIFDNTNFAGGDLGYWDRQGIPLIGGGGVNLVNPQSLYPNLRPGKTESQSNYVNPGLRLYNVGLDAELTPKLKLINNVSFLQFDNTDVLETLRQDGSIGQNIGFDLSTGLIYRPYLNNNVIMKFGAGTLLAGDGTKDLFSHDTLYHVFSNIIFQY